MAGFVDWFKCNVIIASFPACILCGSIREGIYGVDLSILVFEVFAASIAIVTVVRLLNILICNLKK